MESPTNHPTAYALAPRRQQQPPLQSSSIRNLRTLFQLLSDEEFESEVEIERTRRASACRKKPHNNNNNKKRAPPSTAATTDTSRKKKKTNSVSNVTLPVAATRAAAMRDTSSPHSPPPPRSALQPTMGFAMQPAAASGRQETKRQGWDEQYNALLEFKTEHGKVHVSKKEDSSLYWWIAVQRTAWRKFLKGDTTSAALTQTQVDRLIDIGLGTREGGPTNFANCNYSAAWESRFQQVVAFHKEFGHTEVSRHTHKDRFYKLAHWVEVQRGNYNHRLHMAATGKRKPGKWGIMTDEQVEKLSSLSFRFNTTSTSDFDTRLAQLLEYKAAFNDTKVPLWYSSPTGPANLGQWVKYLKKQHSLKVLDPVRVAQLDGVDFDWKNGFKEDDGSNKKKKKSKTTTTPPRPAK